jgi:hypothetical protein
VTMREESKKLLDDAIVARELKTCDSGELARLLQQVNGGAMLDWAVYRKGPLGTWIRRALEALLAPYVIGDFRKSGSARRGGGAR